MNAREEHIPAGHLLLIGVGNEFRGDDGVGRHVARAIAERNLPGVAVVEVSGEGTALMDAWRDAARVILVDAVRSGAKPGALIRIAAHNETVPTGFFHYSTHAFSVAEAVEMDRLLGRLPPQLLIYGIEGADFTAGAALSPPVRAAAERLIQQLVDEISCNEPAREAVEL